MKIRQKVYRDELSLHGLPIPTTHVLPMPIYLMVKAQVAGLYLEIFFERSP